MKLNLPSLLAALVAVLAFYIETSAGPAQGTAFRYQVQLSENGTNGEPVALAATAMNTIAPQNIYVFIGDSRLSSNAVVGTNVWPWLFANGNEPCVVSNYAVPGITASQIWVGWNACGGSFPNPGRPYTAFVAAGVNDLGASYGTGMTTSNLAFAALANIWSWERENGAKPVVAFTVAPNFADLADPNYFINWTNLNTLILGASNSWDFCVNEGRLLTSRDTGDWLHQNAEGVVKEAGFVNATLKSLSGFYYPNGSFINASGPYFPDAIVTNGAGYFPAVTVSGGNANYGPVSIGLGLPGINSLYTYSGAAVWRDAGSGWQFGNGAVNVVTIGDASNMTVVGTISGLILATNTPQNGYALRYTNGNYYWGP
ncbi:MAG: SGNH/GDSL hydrolase family protein [Limisphaerales bacterium]